MGSAVCLKAAGHQKILPMLLYQISHYLLLLILIRYDAIVEFNVDSKAENSALSSTRSQKNETKTPNANAPLIQYRSVKAASAKNQFNSMLQCLCLQ